MVDTGAPVGPGSHEPDPQAVPALTGFDPSRDVEVLSARLGELGERDWRGCSKERWANALKDCGVPERYRASDLAAHGWDILMIDGKILTVQPSVYRSDAPPLALWLKDPYTGDRPPAELILKLYESRGRYEGHHRLFPLPPRDSDGSPEGGDACGSVHDGADPKGIAETEVDHD